MSLAGPATQDLVVSDAARESFAMENRKRNHLRRLFFAVGFSAVCGAASLASAQKPSAVDALKLAPVQSDVKYDQPTREEAEKATVSNETIGGLSGWVVRGDSGQILRRFLDTNGDNKVDQWCYYKDSIEVYRDIDSDFNGKADQYRWLGTGGIRWGLDRDEDGQIDEWKLISAEEVTAEVVAALRDGDANRFKLLLITPTELANLGLSEEQTKELKEKVAAAAKSFAEAARKQTVVGKRSEWVNFGASQPGIVPAGSEGSTKDVVVYDNVAAVVETDKKHAQLVIGTLVKVGDVWRLIDLPKNLSGDAVASPGYFFHGQLLARRADVGGDVEPMGVSPEMQKLITELEKVDKALMAARGAREQAELNADRTKLLTRLIQQSHDEGKTEDRNVWVRQFAETVGAATQSGAFPNGIAQLKALDDYVSKLPDAKELVPFVRFRMMQAEYNTQLQDENADFQKINDEWMKSLEAFVAKYSDSPDAAEAMLQLAIGHEFTGKDDTAIEWFGKIVSQFGDTDIAKKAAGAKRRLESVGKPMQLTAKAVDGREVNLAKLNGRVVLVHYWATWCEPCKQDLQLIKDLQAKYGARGFTPIGVNLDNDAADVMAYLKTKPLAWPQVYEPGGLDSRLANEMGILTLPTMILIDSKGRVVNRNIHASELDSEIRKILPDEAGRDARSPNRSKR